MSRIEVKQQTAPRYLVSLPVRAEWKEKGGRQVIAEGTTDNIGPDGAMVQLAQLPNVGTRITISVQGAAGRSVVAAAEVVRLVRDIRHPLVSISVVNAKSQKEWRSVWESAGQLAAQTAADVEEHD